MHLPGPVRAAVGLIAIAVDEARNLPDRALELPMLAVSSALQASLRAQQRYARLTARGDEALARRRTGDEPPDWATFDEPLPADELHARRNGVGPVERTEGPVPPAKRAAAAKKTATAKETAAAKKTGAAKKTAVKRTAAAKESPAVEQDAPRPSGKTVSSPRHTAPSRFDIVNMPADDPAADPPGTDSAD